MWDRIFNSLHKTLLPLLALAAFGFAMLNVWGQQRDEQIAPKPSLTPPANSPFEKVVAGSGIVEPRTEDISIGSGVPGLVHEVFVKVGDSVRPDDPLFRIDDRSLRADLAVRQAMLASAQASLERLKSMPRKEEIPPSEFRIAEARSRLVEKEDRYQRATRLVQTRSITEEELIQARQAAQTAKEELGHVTADHELLLAGSWKADIQVAEAAILEAEAQVDKVQVEIDRLQVRAPAFMDVSSFQVLQVKLRPGEYIAAPANTTLIMLGNLDRLHVRVDIDEYDIPRFDKDAKAVAKLRGNPEVSFPLTFVRVEPYVVPKRSLTGDSTERVDTRVLQVIYALEPAIHDVYVGQQVDVFVEAQ